MTDKHHKLNEKFQFIMMLAQKIEKSPRKFGTNKNLSHSEIHLVEIIGDNEDLGVTDIGKLLDITKGAVSQGLKKLEKKGYPSKKRIRITCRVLLLN
jgi:DNA-binding MarR family transcriptional regulator